MSEPTVLLEQVSPFSDKQAVVEHDERVTYFYLFGQNPDVFPMKSCWVANHAQAPISLDVASMREGVAPMLPSDACKHPDGRELLKAEDLRIVWFESGDGVALLERNQIVAVIPPWSGYKGFAGYARDCHGETQLCWGLTGADAILDRVRRSEMFWNSWDDPEKSPWGLTQNAMVGLADRVIGQHSNYYAIDGGDWPPKALLRIPIGDRIVLLTIGVSMCEQPAIEMDIEDATGRRRIEIGAVLPSSTPDDEVMQIGSYISSQSRLPWIQNTWLGHGHTVGCDVMPQAVADKDTVLLLSDPKPFSDYQPVAFNGEPITVLWLLPIAESERLLVQDQGSAALLDKMNTKLVDAFLPRAIVV